MPIVSVKKLEDADIDCGTLEEVINGEPNKRIKTRLGREVWTLASIPLLSVYTIDETEALIDKEQNRAKNAEVELQNSKASKQELEYGLSPKADKVYVDQLVIDAQNNIQNFKTEVELLAFTPGIENYTAKALDTKKVWLWDGIEWNDTGLSEYDLAKNYTDVKTKVLDTATASVISSNLLDLSKISSGYRLDTNGALFIASAYFTCDFIPVNQNTEYKSSYADRISFYSANKVHISTLTNTNIATSPINAMYARVSYASTGQATSMFAEASKYPLDFEPYIESTTFKDQTIDAIRITNKAKETMMIDSFKKELVSVNLLNPKLTNDNKLISLVDGSIATTTNTTYVSGFIPVSEGVAYKKTYAARHAYYDQNHKLVGAVQDGLLEFTVPTGAVFMRAEFLIEKKATDMLCRKAEYPAVYVPYKEILKIKDLDYDAVKISKSLENQKYVGFENTLFISRASPNIYNPDSRTIGYRLSDTTGGMIGYLSADVSDFIIVESNQTYSQSIANYTCEYDENKNFITGYAPGAALTFTTSPNTRYVRVTVALTHASTYIFALGNQAPAYQPYHVYMLDPKVSVQGTTQSKWAGKKWNAFGDSITQDANSYWRKIAADKKFAIARDYGIGGTSIAYRDAPEGVSDPALYTEKWMGGRWNLMDQDADLVTIAAGTNDFKQVPLGSFTVRNNATVYGATRTMCEGIIDRFSLATIAAILPFHRFDSLATVNPYTFMSLRDALLEVYDFYGIATFDSTSRLNVVRFYNEANKNALSRYVESTGLYDGLHPNQLCHEKHIAPVIGEWLESLASNHD